MFVRGQKHCSHHVVIHLGVVSLLFVTSHGANVQNSSF